MRDDGSEDSIATLLSRLIEDSENFVRAELRLYRAEVLSRLTETRTAIVMLLTGFLLAQSAIIALLVGLIVILRRPLGPVGATATVVGIAIVVAVALARIAIGKISRATEIKEGS